MIKLVVAGAAGRMGQRIIELATQDPAFKVIYGLEASKNAGNFHGIPIGSDRSYIVNADVIVDFSTPEAVAVLAEDILDCKKPWVVGTTGLQREHRDKVAKVAEKVSVVLDSNMSIGVNILFKTVFLTARALSGYSVEIIEAHHEHKKDAPSGTAIRLAGLIEEPGEKKVKIQSIRKGEIVGDHRVIFSSAEDRLELSHHAESRDIFVKGALKAAEWIKNRKPGLYSMMDVFHLNA